jgi:leader peptidase (prepilin peptidase) / N-methyltransferase
MDHSHGPRLAAAQRMPNRGGMHEIVLSALFIVAGIFAGLAGRWLLSRLPRGTTVHSGWLAGPVALLWGIVGWRAATGHLPWWWLPIPLLLTWFAVLLTATDLRHRRLPNALTLPAYPVAAGLIATAAALGGGWPLVNGALLGAAIYIGVHATVHTIRPTALGAGDVKLSGTLGAILGAVGWPTLVLAAWLAAVCTLGLRILTPRRFTAHWHDGIPHGPGMLAATCLMALFPPRH